MQDADRGDNVSPDDNRARHAGAGRGRRGRPQAGLGHPGGLHRERRGNGLLLDDLCWDLSLEASAPNPSFPATGFTDHSGKDETTVPLEPWSENQFPNS